MILVCGPAAAQDPPCTHAGFEALAPLAGTWEVRASDRVANGEYEETVGRSHITAALGGCALVGRYEGTREGAPYSTLTTFTVTADTAYEQVRLDSGHRRSSIATGRGSAGRLEFETAREMGTRTLRTRQVYTVESRDRIRVEAWLSRADGAEWELTYRAEYRRVGSSR
jgi:hypothetical protein